MLTIAFALSPLKHTRLAPSGQELTRWQLCTNQRSGVYPENSVVWGQLGDITDPPPPPTSLQSPPLCKLAGGGFITS